MALLVSIFLGFGSAFLFAYILWWLDRYEKEPFLLLGAVFLWGALIAAGAAFLVNTLLGISVYLFTGSDVATEISTGSLIAPVVEESLKGLAILLVFIIFRKEFDSIIDGIIYAGITALGFAATENVFYIYSYGYLENGWQGLVGLTFVRIVMVGWQHPFYTAFTGIGLAFSRLSPRWSVRLGAPLVGWLLSVATHSFHNTIATLAGGSGGLIFGTALDWIGWFFMLWFIFWAIRRERQTVERYLQEEVDLGIITIRQYQTACSAWSQGWARLSAIGSGHYRSTSQFYQLCADISHKKHLLKTLGDENGNAQAVQQMRARLAELSPTAAAENGLP